MMSIDSAQEVILLSIFFSHIQERKELNLAHDTRCALCTLQFSKFQP